MKMTEPIGDPLWGPLLIRLGLGSYFVLAGLVKLEDLNNFVKRVQELNLLPPEFSTVIAILLPYAEILFGGLFFLGMWTTLAGIVLSVILVAFVYANGFFQNGSDLFNKDVVLLCAVLSVLYTGAGAFSIDRFRKQG